MATPPSVAVIVPCYNEGETVARTCESLLALEYPKDKLEIILVDDGSTDNTQAAMAVFANNPQVKIIRKENGGKHTALNTGIAATTAEIAAVLMQTHSLNLMHSERSSLASLILKLPPRLQRCLSISQKVLFSICKVPSTSSASQRDTRSLR